MTLPDVGALVLRNARTWGGSLVDLAIEGGFVRAITPAGASPTRVEDVDLDGRLVLPGLWDHHIHGNQWAISCTRVHLTTMTEPDEVIAAMAEALAKRGGGEPLVGFGFRGGGWLGSVTSAGLDRVSRSVPVIAISGDWHSAWLNGPALALCDPLIARAAGGGVLREGAWFDSAARFTPSDPEEVDRLVARAMAGVAARGIVGVIDMEKGAIWRDWRRRYDAGFNTVRVAASVWSEHLDEAIAEGLRTGERLTASRLGTMGPLKIIADGSLNSRTAACRAPYPSGSHGWLLQSAPALMPLLSRAKEAGIDAAVHAIGDRAVGEVLRAFSATGARGSIEHAQLLEDRDILRIARAGLVASMQPQHAMTDRDTVDEVWRSRADRAYRFADLAAANIRLAFGSDAPVAPLDPWHAVGAAVFETEGERPPWHPEQRLQVDQALAASMPPRPRAESAAGRLHLRTGDDADLIAIEADPRDLGAAEIRRMPVAATMVAGRWTHRTL